MLTSLDIYLDHFGLVERPFSLVPDPDFLFWSVNHRRAYATLEYGIVTRAPITVVTGEVGAGKTTLLQQLLRNFGPDVNIGLVAQSQGGRGGLLRWINMSLALTVVPGADQADLFSQFQGYLRSEHALRRRLILIFDEAQSLSRDVLEQLRMLTNINAGKDVHLQLVLIGQPELRSTIARPDLSQFVQRVAASCHLSAMDAATVSDYVAHRMQTAGSSLPIFTPEALQAVAAATGGVPRLVNQLCDLSLVHAYATDRGRVTGLTVGQVLDEGVFLACTARQPQQREAVG